MPSDSLITLVETQISQSKPICVIDTNVIIHLYNNELNHKKILEYIFSHFEVYLPNIVIDEIRRNSMDMFYFCQRNGFSYCPESWKSCRKEITEKDEQKIKGIDPGEREVLSTALRLSREQKRIVYIITDDGDALNLFESVVDHQCIGCLYSSLDLLVYLSIFHFNNNEWDSSTFNQTYKYFKENYVIKDKGRNLDNLCPFTCQLRSCSL